MSDKHEVSEPTRCHRPNTDANSLTHHFTPKPANAPHREIPPESRSNLEHHEPSYLLKMPGEILNQIARLVLVPGRVTAFTSHHHNPYATKDKRPIRFPLLVICKQLHQSFASIFYGENVFCLPPGPIAEAELYFNQLFPAHQLLVRWVSIPFGNADGTPVQGYDSFSNPVTQIVICTENCRQVWPLRFNLICAFHKKQLATGGLGLDKLYLEFSEAPNLPPVVLRKDIIPTGLQEQGLQELPLEFATFFKMADNFLTSQLAQSLYDAILLLM